MEVTVLEKVVPVGSVLIRRQRESDALEGGAVFSEPYLPRFHAFGVRLSAIAHRQSAQRLNVKLRTSRAPARVAVSFNVELCGPSWLDDQVHDAVEHLKQADELA